jgi:hypothetical protein
MQLGLDERRIQELLRPLTALPPARKRAASTATARRRRTLAVAIVAALGLVGGGLAVATSFGPLHEVVLRPNPNEFTCNGVIGSTAAEASAYFESRGLEVSWRFTTWGDQVAPEVPGSNAQAVTGGHSAVVADPPEGSIVWDAQRQDSSMVIVFVQSPDDQNAPRIERPEC